MFEDIGGRETITHADFWLNFRSLKLWKYRKFHIFSIFKRSYSKAVSLNFPQGSWISSKENEKCVSVYYKACCLAACIDKFSSIIIYVWIGNNPLKTALVPFTRKRNTSLICRALIESTLQLSTEANYVAIHFDETLTWDSHKSHKSILCL